MSSLLYSMPTEIIFPQSYALVVPSDICLYLLTSNICLAVYLKHKYSDNVLFCEMMDVGRPLQNIYSAFILSCTLHHGFLLFIMIPFILIVWASGHPTQTSINSDLKQQEFWVMTGVHCFLSMYEVLGSVSSMKTKYLALWFSYLKYGNGFHWVNTTPFAGLYPF